MYTTSPLALSDTCNYNSYVSSFIKSEDVNLLGSYFCRNAVKF